MLRYVYHFDCYIYHFCHCSILQCYILPYFYHRFPIYLLNIDPAYLAFPICLPTVYLAIYLTSIGYLTYWFTLLYILNIYLVYHRFPIYIYIYIRHIYHIFINIYIYIQTYLPYSISHIYIVYLTILTIWFVSPIRRARGFGDRSAAWFCALSSLAAAPLWPPGTIERDGWNSETLIWLMMINSAY